MDMEAKIIAIVAEQLELEPEEITMDSAFISDLGADSFEVIELIETLEEEFGISISDKEADKIQTVGDAVAFVKEHA